MRKISGINKTLVMLLILVASTLTFAQSRGASTTEGEEFFNSTEPSVENNFHHRRGERIQAYIAEQLGLTDDQKAQIKQIRRNHRENVKPIIEELRAKRQDLRKSFDGDTYNEALATQKFSEMAGLKAKLMGEKFKMHKEMLTILTPEQKTKFEQLKEQFKNRRAERMRFRHS